MNYKMIVQYKDHKWADEVLEYKKEHDFAIYATNDVLVYEFIFKTKEDAILYMLRVG